MNILTIDTSNNKEITISLKVGEKEYIQKKMMGKVQVVLPMIEQLLKKQNIQVQELTAIKINTGPGSFTGLRVGIAIANALSFFLKIPINGKKVGILQEPRYS